MYCIHSSLEYQVMIGGQAYQYYGIFLEEQVLAELLSSHGQSTSSGFPIDCFDCIR